MNMNLPHAPQPSSYLLKMVGETTRCDVDIIKLTSRLNCLLLAMRVVQDGWMGSGHSTARNLLSTLFNPMFPPRRKALHATLPSCLSTATSPHLERSTIQAHSLGARFPSIIYAISDQNHGSQGLYESVFTQP